MTVYLVTALDGLAYGLVLFIVGAGLALIFGVLNVMNLAHGTLYLVGAYLAAAIVDVRLGSLILAVGVALLVGLAGGSALHGLLLPLRHDHFPQALLTLGVALLAADVAATVFGSTPLPVTVPAALDATITIGVHGYPVYRLTFIAVAATLAVTLHLILRHTAWGTLLRATVADPVMAAATGINTTLLRRVTFAVGGGLAVVAGVLGAPMFGPAPGTDTTVLVLSLIVVVVGGAGSIPGTAAAAVLVGQVQAVGVLLFPGLAPFVLFGVMLLVLTVRGRTTTDRTTTGRTTTQAPGGSTPILGLAMFTPTFAAKASSAATTTPKRAWSRYRVVARAGRPAVVGAVVVTVLALPGVVDRYTITLAATALVMAVLAMSTQLLLGVAGLPAFGQVAYFGVGAYTAAQLALAGVNAGPVQLVAAALAGAVTAALTAPLALRTRATTFLMVTLAIQALAETAASQWAHLTGGDEGLHTPPVVVWPGTPPLTNPGYRYLYALAVVLTLWAVMAAVTRSRLGLVLRGNADHEPRMAALGHRVTAELTAGYVLAGAVAGAGGALLIAVHRYVSPADLGFDVAAVTVLAAAMGAASMTGAIAGTAAVVAARDWLGAETGGHGLALLGALFVMVAYLPVATVAAKRRLPGLVDPRRRRRPGAPPARPHTDGTQHLPVENRTMP